MENLYRLLKEYYGFDDFRRGQREVIESVINGRDTVAIMPTGGGKSLCYQLPALHFEGVAIVVSPLIALMKDQVDSLLERNIPATFINSSLSTSEMAQRTSGMTAGSYKLVYVAPERFNSPEFMDALRSVRISLLAIDEAHCISEWGHDFRPSYLRVREVRSALGNPLTVALTATATPHVREDIVRQLGILSPNVFVTGFDRPNIFLSAKVGGKADKLWELLKFIREQDGSGIVYAGTRGAADEIAGILAAHEIPSINYHAGMDADERTAIQEAFMNDEYRVIVATNAFGMGIDKSDIRFVAHYTLPGTLESYYQEAGRAGRDGKDSTCLVLYTPSDRYLREFFIKGENPSRQNIEEIYQIIQNHPSQPVLLTYSEIAEQLSEEVPEMAVGTALKVLERYGYVTMANDNEKEASLKVLMEHPLAQLGSRASAKKQALERILEKFGDACYTGVNFSLDALAGEFETKKEALVRALRALKKDGVIDYQPPFRGKEIYLAKTALPSALDIDFHALEEKHAADLDKLNRMEGYIYTHSCRRKYILDYFGESGARERCGACDNCVAGDEPW